MKNILIIFAILLATPNFAISDEPPKPTEPLKIEASPQQKVAQHLQDISVTMVTGRGEGSGEIKTRKMVNGESVNFVWTAAHVVSALRKTRQIVDGRSGTSKTVVEFDDAMVVKALVEDGRMVGKIEFFAEVIRYSADEDLALLRIRKKNFVTSSVSFDLSGNIVPVGTKLLHVGSLLGQLGSNSMTEGIMSQHGRLIDKKIFDQTTVTAFPGSSGGGVYNTEGIMIGMVVRGAGETFNLIVPIRRLRAWAKTANVEWAVDDNIPVPSEEELKKLPVEDNGVEFSYSAKADAAKPMTFGIGRPYLGSEEMNYPTFFKPYNQKKWLETDFGH